MAVQSLYIDEAKKALSEAIQEMEEMSSTFSTLNSNVDSSINAAAGTGMAGQVASVAANVWSEDNVAVFHQLIAATRDFNENKVDPMLRKYEGMGQEAVSTYQA